MRPTAVKNRSADAAEDRPVILKFSPDHKPAARQRQDEQTLGQFIPLVYHYNMLQDEDRVGAFQAAISLVVQPGMRVVELGSGTGILSSFAARRGATVQGIERNPELVDCSRRFLAANGLQDRVEVVMADASRWVPDHPVDVVICEMLHVGLLREKQAQVISAFKQNYSQRFGPKLPLFIPEVSILMCQPVQHCFDFAGYVAPIPLFQAPLAVQPRTVEISPLVAYQTISYDQGIATRFDSVTPFQATSSGRVNAIRMVTQNVLAIDMSAGRAINWPNQCLVLPIEHPFECVAGETIDLTLAYEAGGRIEDVRFGAARASMAAIRLAA